MLNEAVVVVKMSQDEIDDSIEKCEKCGAPEDEECYDDCGCPDCTEKGPEPDDYTTDYTN